MVTVREARTEDFPRIYPLLLDFEEGHQVTEEQWRQLFADHSGLQKGKFGYVLQAGEEIVGFIGTTMSERVIRGEKIRFCNMSNWIVKKEYRGQSLVLLSKVLAMKDAVITNLSPTPQVLAMSQKLKFTLFDRTERIVFPVFSPGLLRPCTILTDPEAITPVVGEDVARIIRDHRLPYNRHALVRSRAGDCYVMFDRSYKTVRGSTRLPFARVHHVSNAAVFTKHVARLLLEIVAVSRVVGMIVEERVLRGHTIWHSFQRPGGRREGAFRSDKVTAEHVDNLYSEHILLNY
jgi:hypothetical protein